MLAMQIASLVSEVGMRKLEEQMAVLKQLRDTWAGREGSGVERAVVEEQLILYCKIGFKCV